MQSSPDISFVMPCFKDAGTLETAVNSILDQDLKTLEIIIVNDGSPDNSNEVIDRLEKQDSRVKSVRFEQNRGACIARNEGAKIATGRYLSFLPADALLYPGNARVWVETLDAHPEFDFMYGGYRFVKKLDPNGGESIQDYMSEPFDPYLLEVTNYIDGSFPLKREAFDRIGGWDPTVKSLQDWDFWIRVVKTGGKGYYFRDCFFETEMPHQGGLSFDSASNWIDRTNYIKEKNGIPFRKVCVASLGASWHARNLAKMLDADFKEMPSFKPHEYEAIYVIGFYPQFADMQGQMFENVYGVDAGLTPAKKIVHFVGTDIWQLKDLSPLKITFFKDYFKANVDVVLTEDKFTQDELKELGIDSIVVPIPPAKLYKPLPLPEEFTVAVYNPEVNKAFYRPELMLEVAKSLPDVKFKFFGDQYERKTEGNIEWMGRLSQEEMDVLIANSSCLLRTPIHDGLSLNALEFLTAGRQVVITTPVKHAIHLERPEAHLIRLALEQAKNDGLNIKASEYWTKRLDHKIFKKTMEELFQYDPKNYWDRRAESWDRQAGDQFPDINVLEPLFMEYKPQTVLDVGCGSGRWYPYFKKQGVEYRGVDISSNLVKMAQKKYPEGMFKTCKVEDIPKPEKKFDLAFCYTVLEHIKEKDMKKAAEALNQVATRLILIEPQNFKSRHYCIDHNFYAYFNIVKEIPLADKVVYVVETKN